MDEADMAEGVIALDEGMEFFISIRPGEDLCSRSTGEGGVSRVSKTAGEFAVSSVWLVVAAGAVCFAGYPAFVEPVNSCDTDFNLPSSISIRLLKSGSLIFGLAVLSGLARVFAAALIVPGSGENA